MQDNEQIQVREQMHVEEQIQDNEQMEDKEQIQNDQIKNYYMLEKDQYSIQKRQIRCREGTAEEQCREQKPLQESRRHYRRAGDITGEQETLQESRRHYLWLRLLATDTGVCYYTALTCVTCRDRYLFQQCNIQRKPLLPNLIVSTYTF
jgi:hypothetical protein